MKNLIIISLFALAATLSSCSKRQSNTAQNEKNAILSKQLEQSYSTQSNNVEHIDANLSASANNEVDYNQQMADKRFENAKISITKIVSDSKAEKIKKLSAKMLSKLSPNQIEKLKIEAKKYEITKAGITKVNSPETVQKTQILSLGQIIIGIIVGAVGLALIALAAAGVFVGSISGLVWVAGVIFFVAGVILVLVGMF